ncbi:MAG: phosphoenolpyruvate carboxykinase (GTP) [Candidatus Aminicenantes bacterium]|nr:phosphoenolpyruvate carboxykinase (GTP) [Candidatus Aminicenantes bacterium]
MASAAEKWVDEQARLAKPSRIVWCDGSDGEAQRLIEIGCEEEQISGPVFLKLNHKLWPTAYLHRSHPTDVARTEHLTFVNHSTREASGPNNNWMDIKKAKALLTRLSDGCMRGRTMYVLPYMMGHPDSPYAKACLMFTDSTYVAVSMRIMTRMGRVVMDKIRNRDDFIKGFHSVGDLSPDRRYIMHFPEESLVWSVGSGYGGNALLGKKCVSLRIASYLGYRQGWLAEHMVVMGIEDIRGRVTYVTAALPSACGKTNLAMMESALPGYRIWTLGDDIAWLNIGPDGRLWAINPEAGYFGVAPGTSMKTNPNMMGTLRRGAFFPTLFTNVGLNTETNEPWWEGLEGEPPPQAQDWQGRPWPDGRGSKAAHPNSRFTVATINTPSLSKEYDNPYGVPISAMIFGGRRAHLIPLVVESLSWANGVFLGARMGSETTAAAAGRVGVVRRDPMAMLPFAGYNMGDYFRHWLNMGQRLTRPPKIFSVNWFRVDENGKFLWPGFGENMRVLKWIVDRVEGRVGARETPAGLVPKVEDLDVYGLDIPSERLARLFDVRMKDWRDEAADIKESLKKYGNRLPRELWAEYEALEKQTK